MSPLSKKAPWQTFAEPRKTCFGPPALFIALPLFDVIPGLSPQRGHQFIAYVINRREMLEVNFRKPFRVRSGEYDIPIKAD